METDRVSEIREEMKKGTSGIAAMERASDAAIEKNRAEAEKRIQAETLINSAAVQELNDLAELQIWGPKANRNYAVPTEPGVLDQIRNNPRYGKTQAEREAAAGQYEAEILSLVDDGYELCQAKLVLDLQLEDRENKSKLIANFIANGEDPYAATLKAEDIYEKKNAKRQKIIKNEGVFTRDEYNSFVRDGSVSRNGGGEEDEAPELVALDPEKISILDEARSNYAKVSAQEGRKMLGQFLMDDQKLIGRWLHKNATIADFIDRVNERQNERLAGSRAQYEEALNQAGVEAFALLSHTDMNDDEIRTMGAQALLEEASKLLNETAQNEAELAGGKRSRVADFWVKNSSLNPNKRNIKGTVKKVAVLGAIGFGIGTGLGFAGLGVLAGAWLGSAVGGAATGAIALRANKKRNAVVVGKNSDGQNITLAQQRAGINRSRMANSIVEATNTGGGHARADAIASVQDHNTTQEILGNRRRVRQAIAIGTAAARGGISLGSSLHNVAFAHHNLSPAMKQWNSWSPEQRDNFRRMMKWNQQQHQLHPGITDAQLVKNWNKYFSGLKAAGKI